MSPEKVGVIIFLFGLFGFMYIGLIVLFRAAAEPLDYGGLV